MWSEIPRRNRPFWEFFNGLKIQTTSKTKESKLQKVYFCMGLQELDKTMMARAFAAEAGANFIYTSGSEFVEIFVG